MLISCVGLAQENIEQEAPFKSPADTIALKPKHSPKKAALLSAACPGLGQIYNKKYWKLPIVYGGLAGLGTWLAFNQIHLKGYTNAYKLELDDDPSTVGSYKGATGENQLSVKRDDAKRNLDLSIILLCVYYSFNILDAAVDAHLYDYSITEDLSVRIEPDINVYQAFNDEFKPRIGLHFTMNFHQVK
ncbi:MAG: hypothetical protein KDC82_07855 [Bacteroidetes bacterium]|nr:hypothetical protein [Bacteroidota bacterium]